MRYWSLRMFSGDCGLTILSLVSLTVNETIVLLSLWLAQNLRQLSALMCNHQRRPSQMKTMYLVMKNVFSWFVFFFSPPNEQVLMVPIVAEASKAEPQQWVWELGALAWIYRLLWTYKLSLLETHPLIYLWVIFLQFVVLKFPQGHRNILLRCQPSSWISVSLRVLFRKVWPDRLHSSAGNNCC